MGHSAQCKAHVVWEERADIDWVLVCRGWLITGALAPLSQEEMHIPIPRFFMIHHKPSIELVQPTSKAVCVCVSVCVYLLSTEK